MKKRPISVTIASVLFLVMGSGLILRTFWSLVGENAWTSRHELIDSGWVLVSGVLALLSGVFMLRAKNWARWLCIFWIGAHVVLSWFHETSELIAHAVFTIVLAILLFRPAASAYFRR